MLLFWCILIVTDVVLGLTVEINNSFVKKSWVISIEKLSYPRFYFEALKKELFKVYVF